MFISVRKRKEKQVTSVQEGCLPINAKPMATFVKNKNNWEKNVEINPNRIKWIIPLSERYLVIVALVLSFITWVQLYKINFVFV